MKRINTVIQAKETKELEKAVAHELEQPEIEKTIASLLVEDEKEEKGENSKGIHGIANTEGN